jgi:type II secretory pathway pseudopilin PulG
MRAVEPRRGFSFTELAFVVAVSALLMAILIPAIFRSRAAARRTQCMNNLKQFSLAMLNYNDVYKKFPVVATNEQLTAQVAGSTDDRSREEFSWGVRVLPYLEEGALYNELSQQSQRFKTAAFDAKLNIRGQHFSTVDVPLFRCPEFAGSPHALAKEYEAFKNNDADKQKAAKAPAGVAVGNYVATPATHLSLVTSTPTKANGMIVPGAATQIRDVRDGLSNTILLVESREEAYASWYGSTGSWVVGLPTAANDPAPDGEKILRTAENTPAPLNFGPSADDKERVYIAQDKWANKGPRAWGPSSQHERVVQHALADGSVHALTTDITAEVYLHLITRNGNEPVMRP